MTYDPQAAHRHWQHGRRPATSKAIAHAPQIDYIRLTRLAILLALILFWVSVFMLIF